MNGKLGRTVTTAALTVLGTVLIGGTAFATSGNHNDDNHDGGDGGRGGKNHSQCAAPVGLSAGALGSSGGNVDQCNSQGSGGGRGGSGDVDN